MVRKLGCGCGALLVLLVVAAAALWIWKPWTQMVPLEMVEPDEQVGSRIDTGDVLSQALVINLKNILSSLIANHNKTGNKYQF